MLAHKQIKLIIYLIHGNMCYTSKSGIATNSLTLHERIDYGIQNGAIHVDKLEKVSKIKKILTTYTIFIDTRPSPSDEKSVYPFLAQFGQFCRVSTFGQIFTLLSIIVGWTG